MSDDVDRAQDETERTLTEALRTRRMEGPMPTGRCLYCDEIVGDNQRWCDGDHRDAWERLRSGKR